MQPIALGLWGDNGHPIHAALDRRPQLRLIALGGLADATQASLLDRWPAARVCASFEQMLETPGLQLVSLCSPVRAEQAQQAIDALDAGVHVYAEKPCATNEADLDRLMHAAARGPARFHEMAGTIFEQPYWAMRQQLARGAIGQVVQVLAQKSYPHHAGRPTRSQIDGGLIAQNGVHAMRFVEHLTGLRATSIEAIQTPLGETRADSDLQMACTLMGRLENGGIFSLIANYLNPRGFGGWGNEMVRIFGTQGMIESTDAGRRTRLIIGDRDCGPLDASAPAPDWLSLVLDDFAGRAAMPFDLETELHPTRMVLRASAALLEQ